MLAAIVPLLCTARARADTFDSGGLGVFVGYVFGENPGVNWGIEAFATHYTEGDAICSEAERAGFGPLARISITGMDSRLTLAAHGGGQVDAAQVSAFDLEGGLTLTLDRKGTGLYPHTGALVELAILNAYIRQDWLLGEYSIGAGARFPPTFGALGSCVEGRPFRDAAGRRQTASLRRARTFDARCPTARRWARRTREEYESIPAFLQLARELLDLDAPLDLVKRALNAAEEELHHTLLAALLAEGFGQGELELGPCAFAPRPRIEHRASARRLAREAWLDGCLNEGLASVLASAEADITREPLEARVSRGIARDEAGHAALAFDLLRWLNREGYALTSADEPPSTRTSAFSAAHGDSLLDEGAVESLAIATVAAASRELGLRSGAMGGMPRHS